MDIGPGAHIAKAHLLGGLGVRGTHVWVVHPAAALFAPVRNLASCQGTMTLSQR